MPLVPWGLGLTSMVLGLGAHGCLIKSCPSVPSNGKNCLPLMQKLTPGVTGWPDTVSGSTAITWQSCTRGMGNPRGTPQSWYYYGSSSMWQRVTILPSNWCTYRASITLWQMLYLEICFHVLSSGRPSTNSHASGISRSLDRDLASLVSKALAGSTIATYKVGIWRFITFCRHLDVAAVPSPRGHIALFATHLSSYLRLPTIRVYLAAVSFLHQASGHRCFSIFLLAGQKVQGSLTTR